MMHINIIKEKYANLAPFKIALGGKRGLNLNIVQQFQDILRMSDRQTKWMPKHFSTSSENVKSWNRQKKTLTITCLKLLNFKGSNATKVQLEFLSLPFSQRLNFTSKFTGVCSTFDTFFSLSFISLENKSFRT